MRFTVRLTHANGEVQVREFEADSTEALRTRVLAEGGFPLEITRTDTAFRNRTQLRPNPWCSSTRNSWPS